MAENGNKIHFKLDTPPDQLDRMTTELENAPTYKFKLEDFEDERRVVAVSPVHKGEDAVTTETTVSSQSLARKLADYSVKHTVEQSNRYERKSVLGEGGAGVVYEMTDHNVGRNVAVKILKDARTSLERQAFIEEGQLAAKLEHPNIIPIYDMDVDEKGQVFLTMKKVQGTTMKGYIDGETELDMEEIILIFSKVCDALEYAHSLDKIHQDIKPENMMIGDYGEVFLIDWGSATAKSDEMQISPVYMSPEQARGEMPAVADDIYCLGASLFHVLTKRFPTSAETISELWDKKTKGLIDMPTARERRTIPRPLLAITLKAMRADVSLRYQSVKEFADDLKSYHAGFATSAENAGIMTQVELLIKRRFREATIILASVLALGAAVGLYHFNLHRKESALVKAQLLNYQMEEERKEHWLPVLEQDFSDGSEIDPRLNVTPDLIEDGGVYLHFQSPFQRVEIDEVLKSDPKVEITFTCDNIPSLMIGFITKDYINSRFFGVRDNIRIINYNKGYGEPFLSTKKSADFLRLNDVNTLQCWRRNNTWYATLNDEPFVEFYDSELTAGSSGTELAIYRHVPLGTVKLTSIKVWNRRPANYVSILDRGQQYRLLGEGKKARVFFLDQARYQEDKEIVSEARFLAAICEGGQSDEQRISELESIANDPESKYQYRALHHLVIALGKRGDWDATLPLLEKVTKEAPELNTFLIVWTYISPLIKHMPEGQKRDALSRLVALPIDRFSFSNYGLKDISFINKPTFGYLSISGNPVKDLSYLRNAQLNYLEIGDTEVTDLSPLRGQPLKTLSASGIALEDLSPLSGMSLDILMFKHHKSLDLSTLKNVSVVKLILDDSHLENPSSIADTKSSILRLKNCGLKNLDFLRDMQPVVVSAPDNEISNIDGLKNKVVTDIHLHQNMIMQVDVLKTVRVKRTLDIGHNPFADISPLMNQPLMFLDIRETNVANLTPLRTMKNLTELDISGPPPDQDPEVKSWYTKRDLQTIGPLTLKVLKIANAEVESITPLEACEVKGYLDLSNNPISDISPLNKVNVKKLNLSDTDVVDLTPLQTMTSLKELNVAITLPGKEGKLSSLKGLEGLKITNLNLVGQKVSDLAQLQQLPELETLHVSGTFSDLKPLKNLPLSSVSIEESRIDDLSVVRTLKNLKNLTVKGSEDVPGVLVDIVPLSGREFNNLNLSYNNITNIQALSTCDVGGTLTLAHNPVKDIKALEGQPLWQLDLSYTNVTDLSVIPTMTNLRRLHVIGLKLDERSQKLIETLPYKVITEEE